MTEETTGIVSFDDWQKLDLRVGKIVEVEDIEGADKLYKLTLDVGNEIGKRIVCAGIKEFYSKKELKNKLCVVFVNLQPKKMRGVESQGMILAADREEEEGKVILLVPEKDIELGSKIR